MLRRLTSVVVGASAESAIGGIAGSAEQRDRTTTVALQTSAQNGTSGAPAEGKHARRRATWVTPRTGVRWRGK